MKKNKIKKVIIIPSAIVQADEKNFVNELSMLSKLNILFEKKLITKHEYEKIKSSLKSIA